MNLIDLLIIYDIIPFTEMGDLMYLYDKNNGNIDVYELRENKEKIVEYKKQELSKISKDDLIFKMLFSDLIYANGFSFDSLKSDFIANDIKKLKNKFFIEKLLYNNVNNKIIIDGILQNYYEGDFDNKPIKNIKNGDIVEKYFIIPDSNAKLIKKGNMFSSDIFEIPYILTLPKSLVLLKDLRKQLFYSVYDKNIDEQLSLFDFKDEIVGRYNVDLINDLEKYGLCSIKKRENDLEISQNILKKVRMINK